MEGLSLKIQHEGQHDLLPNGWLACLHPKSLPAEPPRSEVRAYKSPELPFDCGYSFFTTRTQTSHTAQLRHPPAVAGIRTPEMRTGSAQLMRIYNRHMRIS
jgi:hypothetical protein